MRVKTETVISVLGPSRTPLGDMWRVAEQNPDYSLLQVVESIDRQLWDIEQPTPDQRAVYARLNGQVALRKLREAVEGMRDAYPLDAPARRRQWLATGAHFRVAEVLSRDEVAWLASVCNRLLQTQGTRPIRIFDVPDILSMAQLVRIARKVLAALPETLPADARPALVKMRTLLRRTYPPSQLPATYGNANNQLWHQDSNAKYNDAPMLTLWIPLQEGAGVTCPGIEVINAPVSYFSILHGDSSEEIHALLCDMFPATRVTSLEAGAGDCIVFNGLTFHQTSIRSEMTSHRDALLIRIIEAGDAAQFGSEGAADGIVLLV